MRIVLDTNVLVSGLLNVAGNPGRVVDGLLLGELIVVLDDRILAEYRDVLARPKFRFDEVHRERVLEYLAVFSERVVAPPLGWALPDPGDVPFLEVAAHAGLDVLVTGNARRFPTNMRMGVTVFSPAELVARWARERR